ncbi:MAG: ATP-dependent Clp protease proteolytic subunit, partial [Candidatus Gastranaerophilales bacterium]|nr:ATP-dependent Clp protease proteolytic subunit [Candidatus Gastranaerophilales bacterium]
GQPLKKIEKDTDRDYIMTPEEALEYGMIDKVVTVNTQPKPSQEI